MQRPTWATVVGIMAIIFGCFGVLGGGQEMIMPQMLKFQQGMFATIGQQMEKDLDRQLAQAEEKGDTRALERKRDEQQMARDMMGMFESIWDLPPWFATFSVATGALKVLLSALYLLAGIWLLQVKPVAINLFYWVAGASIVLSVFKGVVLLGTGSFLGMIMLASGVFGAAIDVVLIIVVASADKQAFQSRRAGLLV